MLAWGFGFWMWRLTLACGVMSADRTEVMCGDWPGSFVTWPWRRLSMTYCCALRLWSLICVTCQNYRLRIWSPCLVVSLPVLMPRSRQMVAYVWDGYRAFRQPKFECGFGEILFYRVCSVWQNLYVQSVLQHSPRWPDFKLFTDIIGCCAGWRCEWLKMWRCDSYLWVIWMACIRSGWVEQPQIVMVLPPLTSQLCLVVISWLLVRPLHVVEHLTSWWQMFLTEYTFQLNHP